MQNSFIIRWLVVFFALAIGIDSIAYASTIEIHPYPNASKGSITYSRKVKLQITLPAYPQGYSWWDSVQISDESHRFQNGFWPVYPGSQYSYDLEAAGAEQGETIELPYDFVLQGVNGKKTISIRFYAAKWQGQAKEIGSDRYSDASSATIDLEIPDQSPSSLRFDHNPASASLQTTLSWKPSVDYTYDIDHYEIWNEVLKQKIGDTKNTNYLLSSDDLTAALDEKKDFGDLSQTFEVVAVNVTGETSAASAKVGIDLVAPNLPIILSPKSSTNNISEISGLAMDRVHDSMDQAAFLKGGSGLGAVEIRIQKPHISIGNDPWAQFKKEYWNGYGWQPDADEEELAPDDYWLVAGITANPISGKLVEDELSFLNDKAHDVWSALQALNYIAQDGTILLSKNNFDFFDKNFSPKGLSLTEGEKQAIFAFLQHANSWSLNNFGKSHYAQLRKDQQFGINDQKNNLVLIQKPQRYNNVFGANNLANISRNDQKNKFVLIQKPQQQSKYNLSKNINANQNIYEQKDPIVNNVISITKPRLIVGFASLPGKWDDGVYTINVRATDKVNNISKTAKQEITIDQTAPAAPINVSVSPAGWSDGTDGSGNPIPFVIKWNNPNDLISGAYYKIGSVPNKNDDGALISKDDISKITIDAVKDRLHDGTNDGKANTVYIWLVDNAGNIDFKNNVSATIKYATNLATPITMFALNPPANPNGWNNSIPTITLTSNKSGTTYYQWDGDDPKLWLTYDKNDPKKQPIPQEGKHKLYFYSTDLVDNTESEPLPQPINVDLTNPGKPDNPITVSPAGWSDGTDGSGKPMPFVIKWANPVDLSGIVGVYYKINGAPNKNDDGTLISGDDISKITIDAKNLKDGANDALVNTVYLWLVDNAGNVDFKNNVSATIKYATNLATPITTFALNPPANPNGWNNSLPTITLTSNKSGTTYYQWDGDDPKLWLTYDPKKQPVAQEGRHKLYFYSTDMVDNTESEPPPQPINVDTQSPASTFPLIPDVPNGDNGWYKSVTIVLDATDKGSSGVNVVNYNLDNTGLIALNNLPKTLPSVSDGNHTLTFNAIDMADNSEAPNPVSFKLDSTPPTGSVKINDEAASTIDLNVTLNLSASDVTSGVVSMQFSNDGGDSWSVWEPYQATRNGWLFSGDPSKHGVRYTVLAKFKDKAGRISDDYAASINYELNLAPTIISIKPNSCNQGDTPTVTIKGANFLNGATAAINGQPLKKISVDINQQTITGLLSPSLGFKIYDVTVANQDGQTGTLVNGFTVNQSAPTVTYNLLTGRNWVSPPYKNNYADVSALLLATNGDDGKGNPNAGPITSVNRLNPTTQKYESATYDLMLGWIYDPIAPFPIVEGEGLEMSVGQKTTITLNGAADPNFAFQMKFNKQLGLTNTYRFSLPIPPNYANGQLLINKINGGNVPGSAVKITRLNPATQKYETITYDDLLGWLYSPDPNNPFLVNGGEAFEVSINADASWQP